MDGYPTRYPVLFLLSFCRHLHSSRIVSLPHLVICSQQTTSRRLLIPHFTFSDIQSIGLSFVGIGIGIIIGTLAHPLWASYYRKVAEATGKRPPPEEHLRKGMAGGILVPAALFWFAFTVRPEIHWSVSLVSVWLSHLICSS